jgi:hypothetical protein
VLHRRFDRSFAAHLHAAAVFVALADGEVIGYVKLAARADERMPEYGMTAVSATGATAASRRRSSRSSAPGTSATRSGTRPRCSSATDEQVRTLTVTGIKARMACTYGGDQVSTWSVLRQSCKRRSPVGLLKQPGHKASANDNLALAA